MENLKKNEFRSFFLTKSSTSKEETNAVLLKNFQNDQQPGNFSRTFVIEDKFPELANINNAVQASFFDLYDNVCLIPNSGFSFPD